MSEKGRDTEREMGREREIKGGRERGERDFSILSMNLSLRSKMLDQNEIFVK